MRRTSSVSSDDSLIVISASSSPTFVFTVGNWESVRMKRVRSESWHGQERTRTSAYGCTELACDAMVRANTSERRALNGSSPPAAPFFANNLPACTPRPLPHTTGLHGATAAARPAEPTAEWRGDAMRVRCDSAPHLTALNATARHCASICTLRRIINSVLLLVVPDCRSKYLVYVQAAWGPSLANSLAAPSR